MILPGNPVGLRQRFSNQGIANHRLPAGKPLHPAHAGHLNFRARAPEGEKGVKADKGIAPDIHPLFHALQQKDPGLLPTARKALTGVRQSAAAAGPGGYSCIPGRPISGRHRGRVGRKSSFFWQMEFCGVKKKILGFLFHPFLLSGRKRPEGYKNGPPWVRLILPYACAHPRLVSAPLNCFLSTPPASAGSQLLVFIVKWIGIILAHPFPWSQSFFQNFSAYDIILIKTKERRGKRIE